MDVHKHIFFEIAVILILISIQVCLSEFRGCMCSRMLDMDESYVPRRQLWSYNLTQNGTKECSLYCMEDEACVSFYFNTETYVCSGHSIVLANMTHAEDETGSIYFTMDCRGKTIANGLCVV